MTETVGVIIATFGSRMQWAAFARRALRSAHNQSHPPDHVRWVHGETLQEARNAGAAGCPTDWLIFLDADDELDPYYIESMLAGTGDVRQPATLGVYEDGTTDEYASVIPPGRNLLERNHIVIGAMVRHELFDKVGGFDDYAALEDWALWIKCWLEGAEFGVCSDAIYRVHLRPDSRNQSDRHGRTYIDIRERFTPVAREKRLL